MDPLTHTLTGAALARTRWATGVPYAGWTLVLAANLPDIDVAAYAGGSDVALWWRRGLTHGPLGLLFLPPVLVALLLASVRALRPDAPAPPARTLIALAYLGALTHPVLDWLNTYGIRWLMPFSERWYYGDVLFIVDPWLWLVLGAGAAISWGSQQGAHRRFVVLALLVAVAFLVAPLPWSQRAFLVASLVAALVVARMARPRRREAAAELALVLAACYILLMAGTARWSERSARRELERLGVGPVEAMMLGPVLVSPLEREVVAQVGDGYRVGTLRWLGPQPLRLAEASIPSRWDDPIVLRARRDPGARGFVSWVRFPFAEVVSQDGDGAEVTLLDARYVRPGARSGFGTATVGLGAGP
jgi:inner membrane protein